MACLRALRLFPLLALLHPAPSLARDTAEMERTLAFGYGAIVERHLQPVTAASVALDGMRGLADLDPQLAVQVSGSRLKLSGAQADLSEHPVPDDGDAPGWARLTVDIIAQAAQLSLPVREASQDRLLQTVLEGALGKADLFSRYASPAEARENQANRNGFGGIGIRFDMVRSEPKVVEVIEDTPAARAGLKIGDILMEVDAQSVLGLDRGTVSTLLRGKVGGEVMVALRRDGDIVRVVLKRSLIVPKTVTMTLAGGIAEFRIASFNQRTALALDGLMKEARAHLGPGLAGAVLDLRGNPGGLLDKAVAVAELFMSRGPIVSTRGRHPDAANGYDAHPGDIGEDLPLVVLVDGRTASAAEIVASALQDSGRAVVIGTNSYGKGTVQTVIGLPNGGELTLTWSRFHTPSGYALHGLGVLPALCTGANPMPAAVVDGLVKGTQAARLPETLAVWRQAGLEELQLRARLRDTCPPARRVEERLDMELAERLLQNRAAHARALSLSAPHRTAEVLSPRSGDSGPKPH